MDNHNDGKKPLYFPTNCPDSADYIQGFGQKELGITASAFVIAIIIAVTNYMSNGSMPIALSILAGITCSVALIVKRNLQQESVVDQIMQVIIYSRAQKKFEYKYFNTMEKR